MILSEKDYPKVDGVEYDVNKRWEEGIDHHPKSIEIVERIADIDFIFCNDSFGFKFGGDGDIARIISNHRASSRFSRKLLKFYCWVWKVSLLKRCSLLRSRATFRGCCGGGLPAASTSGRTTAP
jgi:hypothetical protein